MHKIVQQTPLIIFFPKISITKNLKIQNLLLRQNKSLTEALFDVNILSINVRI